MTLDSDSCYRAVKARDRRFDGRFFTAVLTTGIYCRPICPARTPRRENVRFYSCAAAAEAEGFRACRRCRPESAPGTPPWQGTSATVSRALRLIDGGALDEGSVDALAERVGVGERQLRRLFVEHLGLPPNAVALSRRLHTARRLIGQTSLPVSEIAFAAGFGSIRQFNALFRRTFGEAPSEARLHGPRHAEPTTRLRLSYRPPYDWEAVHAFLAARAIPGVEHVDGDAYARTFATDRGGGWLRVAPLAGGLELTVEGASARELIDVVRRVHRVFDLDADPALIGEHLSRSALLRASVRHHPGLRIVGAFDPFEALVRIVVGQQVSVAAARAVLGRIVARFGSQRSGAPGPLTAVFPTPAALAAARPGELPMPARRADALRGVAATFARGFTIEGVDAAERLRALPGVGPWTSEVLAMRAFAEPDAFPAGDLALRRAAGRGTPVSEALLEQQSAAWRPWRAYAAMHLWTLDRERTEDADADHAVAS